MTKEKQEQSWTEQLANTLDALQDEKDVSRIELQIIDVLVQLLEKGIRKRELSAYMQILTNQYGGKLQKVLIGNDDMLANAKRIAMPTGQAKPLSSVVKHSNLDVSKSIVPTNNTQSRPNPPPSHPDVLSSDTRTERDAESSTGEYAPSKLLRRDLINATRLKYSDVLQIEKIIRRDLSLELDEETIRNTLLSIAPSRLEKKIRMDWGLVYVYVQQKLRAATSSSSPVPPEASY